jgi:dipeptidyl-peptidase-4
MVPTKHILLSVCIILIVIAAAQAQKKQYTITEATNGISTTLAPQSIKQAAWQPVKDKLYQVDKAGDEDLWTATSFPSGKKDTVITLNSLNTTLSEKYKSLPAIKWLDEDYVYFTKGSSVTLGLHNANGFNWGHWATLPATADNVTYDKHRLIAYTVDNNLWMVSKDKTAIQVTNEPNKNIVNGQAVHRNEFGIETGIFFSPMSNYLAYYRMDQTMVNDYPIIRWDTVPAYADVIKYPMAGGTSHQVTLCVYNPATGGTITLKTGTPKDQYLTTVTWSPDEKYIYIALLNRNQNHLSLNKYSAETGSLIETLFDEQSNKYVHPTHPLYFIPGHNNEFVWWSERDGYEHLYLYNTSGKLQHKLTSGDWVVNEIAGYNKEDDKLIITAAKESPLEKDIYSVSLNGHIERIDKGDGMHNALCSSDGRYVLDVYNGTGIPRKTVVRATNGNFNKTLLTAPDPLAAYDRPTIKNITLKADDGTPLYGKLILPTNFDASRKYPVIVYLYNGPNVQLIHNSFPESGNLWYEYMAQHGYIVFTMDGRGSWNRGLKFEQATYKHLGDVEIKDQLAGVSYLKSLPYVDANRMGLHGWSFGGYITTSIMLKHPGIFKAAVAGGPVMDWKMYEVMYTERYMGTPQNNPEGYANANLLTKVKDLKGKLLLIHGTADNTVVWQHSINFIKKSVDEGIQVDYFVYPGHEHNVRGKDRVHLMQKVTDYFDEWLK